jgi:hypothetical protein
MANQISDFRQTGGSAEPEQKAPAFARRDSNQTGDSKLFERSELSRFQPDRMRAQGGAQPRQRYFLFKPVGQT